MKIRKNGAWEDYKYPIYGTETDTITTLPTEIIADGNNATVGLVGNMEQSGVPSPSSIIMPSETGDKTENLFDISGVTLGKWYTSSGDLQNQAYGAISEIQNINARNLTIKWYGAKPYSASFVWFDSNRDFISRTHHGGAGGLSDEYTDTVPNNAVYFVLQLSNGINASKPITIEEIETYQTMLNTGSTALPYEPYGYKIPILSGGTTTPVYMGEVQTTRRIKKLVLDGTETWNKELSVMFFITSVSMPITAYGESFCSHYTSQPSYDDIRANNFTFGVSRRPALFIHDERFTTTDELKSYLAQQYAAGTPVTVWYVLATPETSILNEPIRKIGDYADTVSGITIPTLGTAEQFDVDTSLKPSNVELTYKGWHRHEAKKRENGEWV